MDLMEWVHLVHVIASMIWVGGVLVLGALAMQVRRSQEAASIGAFITRVGAIGPVVLAPGPILVLATGIWSIADSQAWSFGQAWVVIAIALTGIAFLFGAAVQSRVAVGAGRAAAAGDEDRARQLLDRWIWGSALILGLLLVATWDMVAKPGL